MAAFVRWLLRCLLECQPWKASGNFEPMDEDTDELDSMGGITCMDGMSSVESSSGDFDSDEGGLRSLRVTQPSHLKVCSTCCTGGHTS